MEETEEKKNAVNFEEIIAEEDVQSLYFNGELIHPNYKLHRLNMPKGRVYFRFQDEANATGVTIYSGTGSITKEIPLGEGLTKYIAAKGYSESKREFYMRMLFGSFSHSRIAEFIMNGCFDGGLRLLPDRLRHYFYEAKFSLTEEELAEMSLEIKKDMVGFERWIFDTKAQFCFVEYPVFSELDSIATQIDIGAFLTVQDKVEKTKKDGTKSAYKESVPVDVFAIINYKTGNIYDSHGYQLQAELQMFEECYPKFTDKPIRIYSLTGKDFKTAKWDGRSFPYIFKDWTGKINENKFRAYLDIAKEEREKRINTLISTIDGDMRIGEDPAKYVITKTIREIIEDGSWRNYLPTSAALSVV